MLRRSTRKVIKTGGIRNLLNFKTLHLYVYLRWYNKYVKILIKYIIPFFARLLGKKGRKLASNHQHSKVLTPESAKAIVTINREIPLHDLEQVIPYKAARNLILNSPPEIAVTECPCRHAQQNPCHPTQVCMIIGQPFVDFSLEHNPQNARRITQEEALELLRTEHKLGHIHTAWFKDSMLGRFYAICNCCRCCCAGIETMLKHDVPVIVPSGYVAQIDLERCIACGRCEEACNFDAIELNKRSTVIWEKCMGCGVCVGQCPNEAISLKRDERKGIPMDVHSLIQS